MVQRGRKRAKSESVGGQGRKTRSLGGSHARRRCFWRCRRGEDAAGPLTGIAPADPRPGGRASARLRAIRRQPVLDAGGAKVGFAYLNTDFTTSVGYSGKPIRIVIGIAPDGWCRG